MCGRMKIERESLQYGTTVEEALSINSSGHQNTTTHNNNNGLVTESTTTHDTRPRVAIQIRDPVIQRPPDMGHTHT